MYPEKGMIQSGQVPLPAAFDERNRNWQKRMKWVDGLDEEDERTVGILSFVKSRRCSVD